MANQTTTKKSKTPLIAGIVVAVLVVLAGGILLFGRNSNKLLEVGKDIEPGEYVLIGVDTYNIGNKELADNYGYYEICNNEKCLENGIIKNDNVFGKAYVVLEQGQFLKTKGMEIVKAADYKSNPVTSLSFNYSFNIGNDYYKVGKDLAAGTYTINGSNYYYAICSKPSCNLSVENDEVIDNYYANGNETTTITLENGQYFVIEPADKPFKMTKE